MFKRFQIIAAHAVALNQPGRLRNMVCCWDRWVYVVNYSRNLVIQFPLFRNEPRFEQPVCFWANDYDSDEFHLTDDRRIVFIVHKGLWIREKRCRTPQLNPLVVHDTFMHLVNPIVWSGSFMLDQRFVRLLSPDHPHTVFSCHKGHLQSVQHDPYTGKAWSVSRPPAEPSAFFGTATWSTRDLLALLTWADRVELLPEDETTWFRSDDDRMPFTGCNCSMRFI